MDKKIKVNNKKEENIKNVELNTVTHITKLKKEKKVKTLSFEDIINPNDWYND